MALPRRARSRTQQLGLSSVAGALAAAVVLLGDSLVGRAADAEPDVTSRDGSAEATIPQAAPAQPFYRPLTDPSAWRFGAYAGIGNGDTLLHLVTTPWHSYSYFSPIYLVAGNAIYSVISLSRLPIDLEIEMDFAQHFGPSRTEKFDFKVQFPNNGTLYYGPQSFQEYAIGPAFRWKWFPWNDYIYTT